MAIEKSKKVHIIYLSVLLVFTLFMNHLSTTSMSDKVTISLLRENLTKVNHHLLSLEHETEILTQENLLLNIEQDRLLSLPTIDYSPSIETVRKILRKSDVKNNYYHEEDYNCVDFSTALIQEFMDYKVYSCYTHLYFEDYAHALVAVNTTRGVIFIEPQYAKIIYSLNVGDDYCDIANFNCEWIIESIKHCFDEVK